MPRQPARRLHTLLRDELQPGERVLVTLRCRPSLDQSPQSVEDIPVPAPGTFVPMILTFVSASSGNWQEHRFAIMLTDRRIVLLGMSPWALEWRTLQAIALEYVVGVHAKFGRLAASAIEVIFISEECLRLETSFSQQRRARRFATAIGELTSVIERPLPI